MTKIIRHKISTEEIEIPDDCEICPNCGGKGLVSDYDMGMRSVVHDPELAAKKECFLCNGEGYLPKRKIHT